MRMKITVLIVCDPKIILIRERRGTVQPKKLIRNPAVTVLSVLCSAGPGAILTALPSLPLSLLILSTSSCCQVARAPRINPPVRTTASPIPVVGGGSPPFVQTTVGEEPRRSLAARETTQHVGSLPISAKKSRPEQKFTATAPDFAKTTRFPHHSQTADTSRPTVLTRQRHETTLLSRLFPPYIL